MTDLVRADLPVAGRSITFAGTERGPAVYVALRMFCRVGVAIALLATVVTGCGLVVPRPVPLAQTCAEWSRLSAEERLLTAEAVVAPALMTSVRERQHLPPESADADVFAAVGSSLTKVCELDGRPGLLLSEIVTSLYG